MTIHKDRINVPFCDNPAQEKKQNCGKNTIFFLRKCDTIGLGGDNMKRFITEKLIDWKNSKNRKPLILKGARQVGNNVKFEIM